MEVLEAIRSRRTIFRFQSKLVSREVLDRIFGYGIWAPNHHLTEPWRFTVIGEKTKLILAERYGEIQMAKAPDHVDDENREKLRKLGYQKLISKPIIVAISCLQEGDTQQNREDYAATCCAMQNVQLAAWNEGVGMQWSTGPITMEKQTYDLLGIDSTQEYIIGFFYTGYPDEVGTSKRNPLPNVLRWTP